MTGRLISSIRRWCSRTFKARIWSSTTISGTISVESGSTGTTAVLAKRDSMLRLHGEPRWLACRENFLHHAGKSLRQGTALGVTERQTRVCRRRNRGVVGNREIYRQAQCLLARLLRQSVPEKSAIDPVGDHEQRNVPQLLAMRHLDLPTGLPQRRDRHTGDEHDLIRIPERGVPPFVPDHRQVDEDRRVNASGNLDDLVNRRHRHILDRVDAFGRSEQAACTASVVAPTPPPLFMKVMTFPDMASSTFGHGALGHDQFG